MDSTTTTATTEETTSTPVTFHSEASNYRVVREQMRRKQLGEGSESEVVGGKDYQFYDGALTVTDPDDIEWLRNYESNGRYYWEIGTDADRPTNSAATQAQIIKLALGGDFGSIAEILVAERSAQSRPEVIVACEAAINASGGDLPAKPDTPLHELQRVRMGPAAGTTPGVSPDPVPGTPMVDPSTLTAAPGEPAAPAPVTPAAETVPPSDIPVQETPPEAPPAPEPPASPDDPPATPPETTTPPATPTTPPEATPPAAPEAPPADPSAGGAAGAPATS